VNEACPFLTAQRFVVEACGWFEDAICADDEREAGSVEDALEAAQHAIGKALDVLHGLAFDTVDEGGLDTDEEHYIPNLVEREVSPIGRAAESGLRALLTGLVDANTMPAHPGQALIDQIRNYLPTSFAEQLKADEELDREFADAADANSY
jgi:hypothetical protein